MASYGDGSPSPVPPPSCGRRGAGMAGAAGLEPICVSSTVCEASCGARRAPGSARRRRAAPRSGPGSRRRGRWRSVAHAGPPRARRRPSRAGGARLDRSRRRRAPRRAAGPRVLVAAPRLELLQRLERLAGASTSCARALDAVAPLPQHARRRLEPHARRVAVAVGLQHQRRRPPRLRSAVLRRAVVRQRALGRGLRGAGRRHAVGEHPHGGVLVLLADVFDAVEVEAESLHGGKRTKAGPPSWAEPAIRSQ